MKLYQLIARISFVNLLVLLFISASAQNHPTETCPESALPEIQFRPVRIGVTDTSYNNYFQFSVDWLGNAATCHHDPPGAINNDQNVSPRWTYFWNFNDETYSAESNPIHAFKNPGTFTVEVALKPIYSDDQDPFGKPKAMVVVPAPVPITTVVIPATTTYSMLPPDGELKLVANWYASRPSGKLTFAITYRVRSQTPVSGKIVFLHSADLLEITEVQRAPAINPQREEIPAGFRGLEALKGYSWEFTNQTYQDGEKTIFIEVKVPVSVMEKVDTSTIKATVFAAMGYDNNLDSPGTTAPDDTKDPDTNVDIAITKGAPPPPKQQTSFFDVLFGLSKAGQDGIQDATLENNYETVYDNYIEAMAPVGINWASDPNFILSETEMLSPGATNETIGYSVHFQNDGSASVLGPDLRVTVGVDPLLNSAGMSPGVPLPQCLGSAVFPHELIWSTKTTLGQDATCKLNALSDARALGFSEDETWGYVPYNILTKAGHVFKEGDTIRAQAAVRMGMLDKKTNVFTIPVGIPAFCSPGFFGLKYTYHLANDEHRSGWGLALTARYPLGKVKNPGFEAHVNKTIKKNNYPLFWWQGELGYGQTRLRPATNDSFFVRHIDVTPFMLRFIARKPPLKLGSVAIQRGWGLSLGYTGSYLLSSRQNGADDTAFNGLSFSERLDHSISVSADLLNLIGQPGLSLGGGYRWRNTQIGGQRHWFSNAFVYLHYTFSYRLRKEFGWLN